MRDKHIGKKSEQNKNIRRFVWFFFFALLFTVCGGVEADEETPAEVITEQPTSIPTETSAPTETPAPKYPLVPDIENFRESYIPVKELLDGSYFRWLKDTVAPTLVPWFQEHEDKIKDDVTLDSVDIPSGRIIVFDISTMPNFEDPQTAPFKRDVTFGYTSWQEYGDSTSWRSPNGEPLMYRVYPVFFWDEKTQQVHPVITITPTYTEDQALINKVNREYLEDMNVTLIHMDDTKFGKKDSIVSQSFDNIGRDEMSKRMIQFLRNRDFSALSDEGIVLLTEVLKAPIYQ